MSQCAPSIRVWVVVLLLPVMFVSACRKSSPQSPESPGTADTGKAATPATAPSAGEVTAPVQPQLVPVPIELPRPMFVGTPQNIQGVARLEKPLGKARPPFLAPAGTQNVAYAKPIFSTDEEPIIGDIEYITDGDKSAADGSYVELGPFVQHITIELGAEYDIYAVLLWHYHKQARVYFDVIVQVSNDSDFITGVSTLFNNDDDNSAGLGVGRDLHYVETNEGKLIDAKGTQARYVRLYSNGNNANDLNHYIEVEVFGKSTK
jgi:hypothetical protein